MNKLKKELKQLKIQIRVGIDQKQISQDWGILLLDNLEEAINYTHCCEELKELDDDNFWHWLIVNGYTVYKDHYMKGDQVFFESELIQKYNNEVMNL